LPLGEAMGEQIKDLRRFSIPTQCRWCEQIRVGMKWIPDRRTVYGGKFYPGVCPSCMSDYFLDSLTSKGLDMVSRQKSSSVKTYPFGAGRAGNS
jgi:hypothetical protein